MKSKADIFNIYNKIIIRNGGKLSVDSWDGNKGGRLVLICNNLHIYDKGSINVNGLGYLGGIPCDISCPNQSYSGDSFNGKGNKSKKTNNGGGGGGSQDKIYGSLGGGGGGYGSQGENSHPNTSNNEILEGGKGGLVYGDQQMTTIYMGSGGGAGAPYYDGEQKGKGGNGGGAIIIIAKQFKNEGKISADGENSEVLLKTLMEAVEEEGVVVQYILLQNL